MELVTQNSSLPFLGYPVEDLTKLPEGANSWDHPEDDGTMPTNVKQLAETVVGHKIVSVEKGPVTIPDGTEDRFYRYGKGTGLLLTLDDGRKVAMLDSSDCCAFTDIANYVERIAEYPHVITGVGTTDRFTKWHIYGELGDVMGIEVAWSPGNPFYYGYGFDIVVWDVPKEVEG
jgi:hypothetical protein